jgi:hypothetical protein
MNAGALIVNGQNHLHTSGSNCPNGSGEDAFGYVMSLKLNDVVQRL